MSAKTISITQDGPANALAINKDFNQVVIAGRNGKGFLLIILINFNPIFLARLKHDTLKIDLATYWFSRGWSSFCLIGLSS